jgi:putative transcriptional regulator
MNEPLAAAADVGVGRAASRVSTHLAGLAHASTAAPTLGRVGTTTGGAVPGQALDLAAGRLVVATPALEDPNFERGVVLLLEHQPDGGAMGLVLNRPSGLPLEAGLDSWSKLAAPPDEVFIGGPVEPEIAIALGWLLPEVAVPAGVRPVLGRVGLVDLRLTPDDLPELLAVRVYSGYTGWAPGQLEAEIAQGAWFTLDADPWDAATADPDNLWHDVFRRQRDDLRLLSTFPPDPSLN